MKKTISLLLFTALLVGCSEENSNNAQTINTNSSSTENVSSTNIDTSEKKEVITSLDQSGEIISNGEVMYTITATEVTDITEEAAAELINDTNYLDYISNGQGQQAVKITLIMENKSGEVLGMPYLDDVKVTDSSGLTSLGGWKDEAGSKTDFGYYSLDEKGNAEESLYTIQNNESRMATSTVVLANESDKINFKFESTMFSDYIEFELPVK